MFLWMKDFNVNSVCALHTSDHRRCFDMNLTGYELGEIEFIFTIIMYISKLYKIQPPYLILITNKN